MANTLFSFTEDFTAIIIFPCHKVLEFSVWIEPIIVFSNDEAKLTVIDPEIEAVVTLEELPIAMRSIVIVNIGSDLPVLFLLMSDPDIL